MAFVMRRWKILLVLNALTVAGFITFWGKCNLRTTKAVGQQAVAADVRGQTHLNGSIQETSITHDVLLKRLGSLEDVVYRQLNGNFFIIILFLFCIIHKIFLLQNKKALSHLC